MKNISLLLLIISKIIFSSESEQKIILANLNFSNEEISQIICTLKDLDKPEVSNYLKMRKTEDKLNKLNSENDISLCKKFADQKKVLYESIFPKRQRNIIYKQKILTSDYSNALKYSQIKVELREAKALLSLKKHTSA